MNLKNCKYMRSEEFKARQVWLKFTDAVGIALEVIADSVDSLREWFKAWSKKPMKSKADNLTLELNFDEAPGLAKNTGSPAPLKIKNIIDIEALQYFGIGSGWCVMSRSEEERYCIKTKREKYPDIFNYQGKHPALH